MGLPSTTQLGHRHSISPPPLGPRSRLRRVIEAVVTIVLIAVFLLVAGFGALLVHRLVRATASPREDG